MFMERLILTLRAYQFNFSRPTISWAARGQNGTETQNMNETTNTENRTEVAGPVDLLVSLASLLEMFYDYQAENGGLPERVHLTKSQIRELAREAETLGMQYETKEPESVWGVSIVESNTGPHLAG